MASHSDAKSSDTNNSSTTNESNPSGNLASMKALVQPYSGEEQIGSNDQDILDFLAAINRMAKLFNWDDNKKTLALELNLIGSAKISGPP